MNKYHSQWNFLCFIYILWIIKKQLHKNNTMTCKFIVGFVVYQCCLSVPSNINNELGCLKLILQISHKNYKPRRTKEKFQTWFLFITVIENTTSIEYSSYMWLIFLVLWSVKYEYTRYSINEQKCHMFLWIAD